MSNKLKILDTSTLSELYKKYPWLKNTTTVEEYVEPKYYDRLLKNYIFNGKTDLKFFGCLLDNIKKDDYKRILELGCGSGRATKIFFDKFYSIKCSVDLVDLSGRMLKFCKDIYKKRDKTIGFVQSDSIVYLQKTRKKYNIIFSLWSFSHSVHQLLTEKGLINGKKYIEKSLKKMIEQNMESGSIFFLMHFDSLSDEQRILIRQWKKVFPIFKENKIQSPSKLLLDDIFEELQNKKKIDLKRTHYIGKAIEYKSIDEALEIFLNFHMESYFNKSKLLPGILGELKSYFKKYQKKDGRIFIKPRCFIYKIVKK